MQNQDSVPAAVAFAVVEPELIIIRLPVLVYDGDPYVSICPAGGDEFIGVDGNATDDGYILIVEFVENKTDWANKVVARPVFEKGFNDIVINLTPILFYYLS